MMINTYQIHIKCIIYICQNLTPRVNYIVNYGLQVVMMCQYRFISYKKCTIRARTLMVEEAVYVGLGRMWELSILLVNFAVNLKLL